jgi:hypothetical protein
MHTAFIRLKDTLIRRLITVKDAPTRLTKQAERVVKKLRRNLNTALGDEFPQYREANTKFSESLQALDDIQEAVGKKVNFDSDRAGEALALHSERC